MRVNLPSFLGTRKPGDRVRVWLTRGLEVRAGTPQVRRGEKLDVTVTVHDAGRLGSLEVGLVCTERTSEFGVDGESASWATDYECWVPLEPTNGEHFVSLEVPIDGPYSYRGSVLALTWEVVARGVRTRRVDARAACDLEVHP